MSKTNGTATAAAPISTTNAVPTGGGGNQVTDTATANPPDDGSGDPVLDDDLGSGGGNAVPTGGGGSGLTTESTSRKR